MISKPALTLNSISPMRGWGNSCCDNIFAVPGDEKAGGVGEAMA
jgi:hypothetical protein